MDFIECTGGNIDLSQVCLRRKVGKDRLGTFAAFRMVIAKIGTKICCSVVVVVNSHSATNTD